MSIHINEIDQLVAGYLSEINTKYNVVYVANKENDPEWQRDEWLIMFNGEQFTYNTGLGHRITPDRKKRFRFSISAKDKAAIKELKVMTKLDFAAHEIVKKRGHNTGIYAITPTQASVLYCLLLDAQALDTSFEYWCDELGYNSDSMKDFRTYQACCDNAKKLNKVFTREQQNKLSELLEEY